MVIATDRMLQRAMDRFPRDGSTKQARQMGRKGRGPRWRETGDGQAEDQGGLGCDPKEWCG